LIPNEGSRLYAKDGGSLPESLSLGSTPKMGAASPNP
jgi:hypothetical protein